MKGRSYWGGGKGSAKASGPTVVGDSRRYKSSSGNLRASVKAAGAILLVLTRHALGRADVGVAGRVRLTDEST